MADKTHDEIFEVGEPIPASESAPQPPPPQPDVNAILSGLLAQFQDTVRANVAPVAEAVLALNSRMDEMDARIQTAQKLATVAAEAAHAEDVPLTNTAGQPQRTPVTATRAVVSTRLSREHPEAFAHLGRVVDVPTKG